MMIVDIRPNGETQWLSLPLVDVEHMIEEAELWEMRKSTLTLEQVSQLPEFQGW